MGILEKNKPHAPSPRATLLDAGEKVVTCLAPLVRTPNALPPVFPEGLLRNPAHSRVIPLSHSPGPIQRATTLLVRATEAETAVTTIALRKRGEISPYEL